jgi:hypothetical protein
VGEIYSEDAMLLLRSGRPPAYDDPDTMAAMANLGNWDDHGLVQDLRDRRFPLILMRHTAWRWSDAARPAVEGSYDLAFQGTIDVYKPKVYPDAPATTLNCDLGAPAALRLVGVSLGPGARHAGLPAGQTLPIRLHWQVAAPPGDWATFVHLLDKDGKQVAGRDNPRGATGTPLPTWPVGGDLAETTDLPLPAGLPAGTYRLIGGVYGTAGGGFQAVPVACPDPARRAGDAVDLGPVVVR